MSSSPRKRIWLLTGEPGVGKTTVISKTIRLIQSEGLVVGGVITREVRRNGIREGFELIDLSSEKKDILASSTQPSGPKIGRYRVNLRGLADLGAPALLHALQRSDVVVCDEIGPMELFSPEFRRAVKELASSTKPAIGVIHKQLPDPLVEEFKHASDVEVTEVRLENRDNLPNSIAGKVLKYLKGS